MPVVGKAQGCKDWSCDQFREMFVYKTMWQLPKDFGCEHCKLQFFYLTGAVPSAFCTPLACHCFSLLVLLGTNAWARITGH